MISPTQILPPSPVHSRYPLHTNHNFPHCTNDFPQCSAQPRCTAHTLSRVLSLILKFFPKNFQKLSENVPKTSFPTILLKIHLPVFFGPIIFREFLCNFDEHRFSGFFPQAKLLERDRLSHPIIDLSDC